LANSDPAASRANREARIAAQRRTQVLEEVENMVNGFLVRSRCGIGGSLAPFLVLALVATAIGADRSAPRAPENVPRDVLGFGAVGDGKIDDTAAIQKAIDEGSGQVHFPTGVYRLTRPVVIDLDRVGFTALDGGGTARVVMAGPGPAFRFIGTHEGSAAPGEFKPNVWERQRSPQVVALEIVGDHPEACGIEAVGTVQLTVSRLAVRRALHAIHLTRRNRNILISDCHLYDNRGIGIFYDQVDLHQSNIVGCHISYNKGGGIVSSGGNVRNIHIGTCDIESNQGGETAPTANVLIDSSGSDYGTGEVAITGCTLQHNNPSPDSANIRIIGRSKSRPSGEPVREGNVTITGNVLSDVKVNVHLKDCRGVVLEANTFWQGYTHNLLVEDCTNIVIGPNNFDRNPRYNYGNTQQANNPLVLRNCEDCTLNGLHITSVWRSPAGLSIEKGRRINLTNCTILDCDGVGLLLRDVSHSRVSGCLIRDDRRGGETSVPIKIVGGEGNLVTGNLVRGRLAVDPGSARLDGNGEQP
jgi:hypothetical protein